MVQNACNRTKHDQIDELFAWKLFWILVSNFMNKCKTPKSFSGSMETAYGLNPMSYRICTRPRRRRKIRCAVQLYFLTNGNAQHRTGVRRTHLSFIVYFRGTVQIHRLSLHRYLRFLYRVLDWTVVRLSVFFTIEGARCTKGVTAANR